MENKNQIDREVESERSLFKTYLVKNPNYFGTLSGSDQKAIKPMSLVISYEELTAVAYNPETRNLEATLVIKKPIGYNGTLCTAGSIEYVRFFLDYGAGWIDQGLTAVNVHDIPTTSDCEKGLTKPISYIVTLPIKPHTEQCGNPVIPMARAILSWQVIPTAGDPNYPVVWGNKMDCAIQIKPYWWPISINNKYLNEFFNIAYPSQQVHANKTG
jgi:hypothetical protein